MRNYSIINRKVTVEQLQKLTQDVDDALASVGTDRMVVGHSIHNNINAAMNGRVWRIDLGGDVPRIPHALLYRRLESDPIRGIGNCKQRRR